MKTILITGCAGFLGRNLAEHYLNLGHNVIGLDNFITGSKKNIADLSFKFKNLFYFIESDIANSTDSVEKKMRALGSDQLDLIFHFASAASVPHYQKYKLDTMAANSTGLLNCLLLSEKYKSKVIFASTSEIYGDPQISPQSETYFGNVNSYGPRSCYDESKRFGEALIYSWNEKHQTNHGILRIFNTYGPHMNFDDGRVILRLCQQALKNQDLTIYGDGTQTRSFCYVDDLISGIDLYSKSDEKRPMNLGNDSVCTINDVAALIIQLTNSKSKIQYLDLPIDDPKNRKPDLSFAFKTLGYKPEIDLKTGLVKMIAWLRK